MKISRNQNTISNKFGGKQFVKSYWSFCISVTSREEVYSISEVELFASTWPPKGSASAEISGNQNDGLDDKPLEIGDILLEPKQELSTCEY